MPAFSTTWNIVETDDTVLLQKVSWKPTHPQNSNFTSVWFYWDVCCIIRETLLTFISKRKNLELLMNFVKLTRSCSFLSVTIHSLRGILYYSLRVYISIFNILLRSQNDGFLNLLIILIFAVFHSAFIQHRNSPNWNRLLTST